jgi:hypothetical protein
MSIRKTNFPCGHRGKGRYCHRCACEAEIAKRRDQAKSEWKSRLSSAPIPLGHLPADVADKTLGVIAELERGASYLDYLGKRLKTMGRRDIISIRIGRRHRLICRESNGSLEFVEALTHEEYNSRLASGGWAG